MKHELNLGEFARMIRDVAQGQGEMFIAGCAAMAVEYEGMSETTDEQIRNTLRSFGVALGVLDG
ncbi:hypothetical protein JD276_15270 [Leucobacter sp. CSA1]|uniref:Uncharacterized protein n=1 Tax=Leucobacter chromiisoli TaxID=2796471 RepID=A0A934QA86_9MICO|nr:hypothetical protein [Leucobacter chromiisoli]MBK0420388.1 hypothetical protein [Leucobacter chromiisoli]